MLRKLQEYGLKMNPKKYAFSVSSGKFMGILVHQRDIDVDSYRVPTIGTFMPLENAKELKILMGKLSYIRCFIPGLVAITGASPHCLRKGINLYGLRNAMKPINRSSS